MAAAIIVRTELVSNTFSTTEIESPPSNSATGNQIQTKIDYIVVLTFIVFYQIAMFKENQMFIWWFRF